MSESVQALFVQALQRRMQGAPEAVQRVLQDRLQRAVADAAKTPLPAPLQARPMPAITPLAQLNRSIATTIQAGPDLRSALRFRETWSIHCAEDEVSQAVERGPENAGPLNSHRLVLHTLGHLRDLSPDYLRRFMAHTDTLLWLEQAQGKLKETAGKTKPVKTGRVKK